MANRFYQSPNRCLFQQIDDQESGIKDAKRIFLESVACIPISGPLTIPHIVLIVIQLI